MTSSDLVELNSDFEEQPQLDGIRKKAVKIPRSGSLGSTDISLKHIDNQFSSLEIKVSHCFTD